MPRNKPITDEEIARSVVRFREARTLHDLGLATREVFLEIFDPGKIYFYYMFGGRLCFPFEASLGMEQFKESVLDVLTRVKVYDPLEARRRDRLVHHSSEVYQWHEDQPQMTKKAFEEGFSIWELDWAIGAYYLDRDVLIACAGVGNPYHRPDFSKLDLEAMQALYPHLDAAFKVCFEAERRHRFGDSISLAIENHPCPLYFFKGGEMTYANYEGRLLITQDTNDVAPEWPLWNRSPGVKALAECAAGKPIPLPAKVANARFVPLPYGIGSGEPATVMAVLDSASLDRSSLTEMECRVLESLSEPTEIRLAARDLGIKESTLRTHLRNSYRKLGVSNLSEASLLFRLSHPLA